MVIFSDDGIVRTGTKRSAFAAISVVGNNTETAIVTQNVAVQVAIFNTNGPSRGATPDHTNDHITIDQTGTYYIAVSATVNSIGGLGSRFEMTVLKNDGTTLVGALHVDRDVTGGGGESGSASMSDIVDVSAGDTIEVWIENETNTQNYIVEDITLIVDQKA